MNVTTELTTHLTSLITGAFTSLASLIASPLGGLIIFGLAVSYIFYVKRMASAKNAK
jgi:hypothetical protein